MWKNFYYPVFFTVVYLVGVYLSGWIPAFGSTAVILFILGSSFVWLAPMVRINTRIKHKVNYAAALGGGILLSIMKVAPPSRPRKYGRQPKRIRRSAVLAACQKNILDDDWEDA